MLLSIFIVTAVKNVYKNTGNSDSSETYYVVIVLISFSFSFLVTAVKIINNITQINFSINRSQISFKTIKTVNFIMFLFSFK